MKKRRRVYVGNHFRRANVDRRQLQSLEVNDRQAPHRKKGIFRGIKTTRNRTQVWRMEFWFHVTLSLTPKASSGVISEIREFLNRPQYTEMIRNHSGQMGEAIILPIHSQVGGLSFLNAGSETEMLQLVVHRGWSAVEVRLVSKRHPRRIRFILRILTHEQTPQGWKMFEMMFTKEISQINDL